MCKSINKKLNFDHSAKSPKLEKQSFYTWLFDNSSINHTHIFKDLTLTGGAMLAVYRQDRDNFTQKIIIQRTSGDRSGTFFVGPSQELTFELPYTHPDLAYKLHVYENGTLTTEKSLYINNITLDLKGKLSGAKDLYIGPNGVAIIR